MWARTDPVSAPIATIIVVTFNSARWMSRQRAALEAQTETRWRLVVVDNASEPDQRPTADALPANARLTQNEINLGFAEANNIGAAGAGTPYLVFLNPDAFPAPDWLATLIETAEHHADAVAIGSTQVRADSEDVFDGTGDVLHASGLAYRSNFGKRKRATPPLGETFSACAAAMLARREAFEAVGGFDPAYFCFFEDVDLGFRLRLRGGRILQSPDAIVAHVGGGATTGTAFASFHGARNRTWTFFKCMPAPWFWLLLPAHLIACALAATVSLFAGRGFAAWRGFLVALATLDPILKARAVIQRARVAPTRDIAAALTWSPHLFFGRRPFIRPLD
jgi:N-acetylglucosaminyl-diphospho-decaprenol L-rhamnosyltransferase